MNEFYNHTMIINFFFAFILFTYAQYYYVVILYLSKLEETL